MLDRRQAQAANRQAAGADINAPDASSAVVKTTQELAKTNLLFARDFVCVPVVLMENIAKSTAKVRNTLVKDIFPFLLT